MQKVDYQSALRLKPGESYPETQLKLIADQLDSERRLKEEEALRLAQEKRKQQQEANKINVSGKPKLKLRRCIVKCGRRKIVKRQN